MTSENRTPELSAGSWLVSRPLSATWLAWGPMGVVGLIALALALLWPCWAILGLAQISHQPLTLLWLAPTVLASRPGQRTLIHAVPWLALAVFCLFGLIIVGRWALVGLLPLYGWGSTQLGAVIFARSLLKRLAASENTWSAAVDRGYVRAEPDRH